MKIYFILFSAFFLTQVSFAQTASIYGKITDEESGEELIFANVVLEKNGVFAAGASTDFEGNYSISFDPGIYEIKVTYPGYKDRNISDVVIKMKPSKLDITLALNVRIDKTVVTGHKVPYISPYPIHDQLTSEEIKKLSPRDISALAAMTAGISEDSEKEGPITYYKKDTTQNKGKLIPQEEIDELQRKNSLSIHEKEFWNLQWISTTLLTVGSTTLSSVISYHLEMWSKFKH